MNDKVTDLFEYTARSSLDDWERKQIKRYKEVKYSSGQGERLMWAFKMRDPKAIKPKTS